jgi:hypothetical protein
VDVCAARGDVCRRVAVDIRRDPYWATLLREEAEE